MTHTRGRGGTSRGRTAGRDAAIGVFDSGVGGLTVLRALRARLPGESTVYLGDTARVPYGTKSAATVIKYAINNARTLVEVADIKVLVVACNTASAVCLPALREALDIPVVGVIEPGARAALAANRGGAVLVLGTAGTVRSGAYPAALRALGATQRVETQACPLFVPLAEEGWTDGDVPRLVAARYVAGLAQDIDTVVLGCTHYPLLRPALRAVLPAHVAIVDGAEATAAEVEAVLARTALRAEASPAHRLLVTDAPEQLARLSAAFLGEDVAVDGVEVVDVRMTS